MQEPIQDSITRLLRYQRAPEKLTAIFPTWKHNADLLPRLQVQLEMILDAYGKFSEVVYDIQGIRDDGADVVVKCRPQQGSGDPELICFQVKSFDDLNSKSYLQSIKSQRDDAFRKITGLSQYFILLCTDMALHRNKVRSIATEYKSAPKTEVIEPVFAVTFLTHRKTRVEALIKRIVESDDIVFRRALESVELESPSARALMVFLTVKVSLGGGKEFTEGGLLADHGLKAAYEELRQHQEMLLEAFVDTPQKKKQSNDIPEPVQLRDFEDQIAADLDLLETDIIDLDPTSNVIHFHPKQARPLHALMLDALVRYEYSEAELMEYMFDLFVRE